MTTDLAKRVVAHYLDLRQIYLSQIHLNTFEVTLDTLRVDFPALQESLRGLPARQLRGVWLHLIRGFTQRHTADLIGITENTLRADIHKAMEKISNDLAGFQSPAGPND